MPVLPEALSLETVGDSQVQYYQLDYTRFIPHLIGAVQALFARLTELADKVASFADHFTTRDLTFTRAAGDELHVNKLCGGVVCVSEPDFLRVFGGGGSESQTAAASAAISASTTLPIITVAGNNPAHINIGDTYNDLGATAKDSEGHDLGVKTFLNGALVSDIVLDTSQAATDTINYVATDTNGLTSTSTRTVFVEGAQSSAEPLAEQANSTPQSIGENASSTAAQ